MGAIRHLIGHHIRTAWVLVALTLAMKLIVPVGFMPVLSASEPAIVSCTGMGPADMAMEMPGKMPGMPGMSGHDRGDHAPAKPDAPCLGAGIAAPVLSGADPIQLVLAIAVAIVARLLLSAGPPPRRAAHLHPPSRGPPRAP